MFVLIKRCLIYGKGSINRFNSFFIIINTILLLFLFSCGGSSNSLIISDLRSFKSLSSINVVNFRGISLSLPEDWNFTFNFDDDIITSFDARGGEIMGQLGVYSSYKSSYDLKKIFLDHLDTKDNVVISWISFYSGGFVAKGVLSKYEKYLRSTISYTIYLSLFALNDKVYEISVLGSGDNSFEEEALFLINSLSESSFMDNTFVKRYSLGVEITPNWLLQSTTDNQVINLKNKDKEAILVISYLGASNLNPNAFVLKHLEEFKSYLVDESELDYYYDIKDMPILSKNNSILLQFFGELGSDSIEIRKYYFKHSGNFYLLELWYKNDDWLSLKEDFDRLMSTIKLY